MSQMNDQEYYFTRALASRDLEKRAANPSIAAIHADFAARYENLAVQPERRDYSAMMTVQAVWRSRR